MPTIGQDINWCSRFLRDPRNILWPRDELLRWYNDGLRRLLTDSHGVRRFTVLPIPPQHTISVSYAWERRYVLGGSHRQFTFGGGTGSRRVTALWELEQAVSIAHQTPALPCVTQLWELAYAGGTEHPYRFALPRDHDRLKGMWYDHEAMTALPSRAVDCLETAWNRSAGEPWAWLPGYGETRSFEVYQIRTDYTPVYTFRGATPQHPWAMPRRLSGERTYTHTGAETLWGSAYTTQADSLHAATQTLTGLARPGLRITSDPTPNPGGQYQSTFVWERERHEDATTFTEAGTIGTYPWEAAYGATNVAPLPVGMIRRIHSPERQYLPWEDWVMPLGIMRFWASSASNVLLHEAVIPDLAELTEAETPVIIPPPLQKYLRYYVMYCAHARQGEGFRPDLAAHWKARYDRGVILLRKLSDITFADIAFQRNAHGRHEGRRYRRSAPYPPEYGVVEVR